MANGTIKPIEEYRNNPAFFLKESSFNKMQEYKNIKPITALSLARHPAPTKKPVNATSLNFTIGSEKIFNVKYIPAIPKNQPAASESIASEKIANG